MKASKCFVWRLPAVEGLKTSLWPDGVDTALADPAMRDPVARGGGVGLKRAEFI